MGKKVNLFLRRKYIQWQDHKKSPGSSARADLMICREQKSRRGTMVDNYRVTSTGVLNYA